MTFSSLEDIALHNVDDFGKTMVPGSDRACSWSSRGVEFGDHFAILPIDKALTSTSMQSKDSNKPIPKALSGKLSLQRQEWALAVYCIVVAYNQHIKTAREKAAPMGPGPREPYVRHGVIQARLLLLPMLPAKTLNHV